jgi:hypothetical protein
MCRCATLTHCSGCVLCVRSARPARTRTEAQPSMEPRHAGTEPALGMLASAESETARERQPAAAWHCSPFQRSGFEKRRGFFPVETCQRHDDRGQMAAVHWQLKSKATNSLHKELGVSPLRRFVSVPACSPPCAGVSSFARARTTRALWPRLLCRPGTPRSVPQIPWPAVCCCLFFLVPTVVLTTLLCGLQEAGSVAGPIQQRAAGQGPDQL